MNARALLFSALIAAGLAAPGAAQMDFAAADCFAPVIEGRSRPGCPERATFAESQTPMDVDQFKQEIAGIWRTGYTCSGLPVPMERFLGKDISVGQSANRPIMGVQFGENDTYSTINFGVYGDAPLQPKLGTVAFKCTYAMQKAEKGFFLITCGNYFVYIKPVQVRENGEWVLRSGAGQLTPYICPAGTELITIYSRAPGF